MLERGRKIMVYQAEDQVPKMLRSLTMVAAVVGPTLSALSQDGFTLQMSVAEVVAALDSSDLSASEIRALASYDRLEIVDLSKLEDDEEFEELEEAMTRVDDGWAMVQTAIAGNDLLRQVLRERSVSIQKVAAASEENGVVIIYLR